MEDKIKRKTVYIESPYTFEMGPCECGNEHTQWSEYEKHLWCEKCEIDFIPKDQGLFSSPIPMKTAQLLGFSFNRFNLETNRVEVLDSDYHFTELQMMDNIMKTNKLSVIIKSTNNLEVILEANLILENNDLTLLMNDKLKESILSQINNDLNTNFKIELITDDPKINKVNLQLIFKNDNLIFIQDKSYLFFVKYILNKKLETMEIKEQVSKHKI